MDGLVFTIKNVIYELLPFILLPENKKPHKHSVYRVFLYSRRDLNPHGHNAHRILSPACLPIPPLEPGLETKKRCKQRFLFERKTGFEPATSTLAR